MSGALILPTASIQIVGFISLGVKIMVTR